MINSPFPRMTKDQPYVPPQSVADAEARMEDALDNVNRLAAKIKTGMRQDPETGEIIRDGDPRYADWLYSAERAKYFRMTEFRLLRADRQRMIDAAEARLALDPGGDLDTSNPISLLAALLSLVKRLIDEDVPLSPSERSLVDTVNRTFVRLVAA